MTNVAREPTPEGRSAGVAPLRCTACGAAVPLGEADHACCTYCGVTVPVPPALVTLRANARLRANDRAALDALYAEASRPPARALDAWAWVGSLASLGVLVGAVVLTIVTVIAVLVIELRGPGSFGESLESAAIVAVAMVFLSIPAFLETCLHFVGSHGLDAVDALGPGFGVALGLGAYVLVAVPVALGGFANESIEAITDLRTSLRAAPPLHPGGPAICRNCGAALDVPAGALGVPCMYCRTDNLVAVPDAVASRDERAHAQLHRQVKAALEAHHRERATIRSEMTSMLLHSLVLLPLFGIAWLPAHWVLEDGRSTVTMLHRADPGQERVWPEDADGPLVAREEGTLLFPSVSCADRNGDQCTYGYVALERGDRLFFEGRAPSIAFVFEGGRPERGDLDRLSITLERHAHGLGACAGHGWVDDPGVRLDRPVPYTGWYRLAFRGPPALREIRGLRWIRVPANSAFRQRTAAQPSNGWGNSETSGASASARSALGAFSNDERAREHAEVQLRGRERPAVDHRRGRLREVREDVGAHGLQHRLVVVVGFQELDRRRDERVDVGVRGVRRDEGEVALPDERRRSDHRFVEEAVRQSDGPRGGRLRRGARGRSAAATDGRDRRQERDARERGFQEIASLESAAHVPPVVFRWSARRCASATMVSVGFESPPVGKTEPPAT